MFATRTERISLRNGLSFSCSKRFRRSLSRSWSRHSARGSGRAADRPHCSAPRIDRLTLNLGVSPADEQPAVVRLVPPGPLRDKIASPGTEHLVKDSIRLLRPPRVGAIEGVHVASRGLAVVEQIRRSLFGAIDPLKAGCRLSGGRARGQTGGEEDEKESRTQHGCKSKRFCHRPDIPDISQTDSHSMLVNAVDSETTPIGSVNQGVSHAQNRVRVTPAPCLTVRTGHCADVPLRNRRGLGTSFGLPVMTAEVSDVGIQAIRSSTTSPLGTVR